MLVFITETKFWSLPRGLVRQSFGFGYSAESYCSYPGVRIIYLPPYSPDLNPIEEAISKIKAWMRRNNDLFSTDNSILFDVKLAMDVITSEDAEGYFLHAGYF